MTVVDAPDRPLPRPYLAWLGGFTVARSGDAVLAFALGWAAAGLGGTTAALVVTLGGLPASSSCSWVAQSPTGWAHGACWSPGRRRCSC